MYLQNKYLFLYNSLKEGVSDVLLENKHNKE